MTKLKKTYKKKYYGGMNTNQWAAAFTYQINNPGSSVYIKHKTTGEIRKISTNIGRGQRFNVHQLIGEMGDWDIYVKNNGNYYQIGSNNAQLPKLTSVDIGLFTNKLVENYFLTKHSLERMSPSNSPSASSSSSAVSRITSTYAGGGQPPLNTAKNKPMRILANDLLIARVAVNNLSTITSPNSVTPLNIDAAHSNTVATVASSNTAAAAAASSPTDDNARLMLLRSQLEELQGPSMIKQFYKGLSFVIAVIAICGGIWYKINQKKGGNPTLFSYEKFFENPTLHGCALFFEKLNADYKDLIPISNTEFQKLNKKGGRQNTRKKNKK